MSNKNEDLVQIKMQMFHFKDGKYLFGFSDKTPALLLQLTEQDLALIKDHAILNYAKNQKILSDPFKMRGLKSGKKLSRIS